MFIGGYNERYNQFRGIIDEVAIWRGALTAEEIKAKYDEMLKKNN